MVQDTNDLRIHRTCLQDKMLCGDMLPMYKFKSHIHIHTDTTTHKHSIKKFSVICQSMPEMLQIFVSPILALFDSTQSPWRFACLGHFKAVVSMLVLCQAPPLHPSCMSREIYFHVAFSFRSSTARFIVDQAYQAVNICFIYQRYKLCHCIVLLSELCLHCPSSFFFSKPNSIVLHWPSLDHAILFSAFSGQRQTVESDLFTSLFNLFKQAYRKGLCFASLAGFEVRMFTFSPLFPLWYDLFIVNRA